MHDYYDTQCQYERECPDEQGEYGDGKWLTIPGALLVHQTEKAGKFWIEGEEYWIPWSQVSEDCALEANGDQGALIITKWIAQQKGIQCLEM